MHRQSIAVPGDSAAAYALLKLIPSGTGSASLPLDVALVLDISGSMYEEDGTGRSRLDRIREAALAAAEKLRPTDRLAIVAFGHGAQTVLPPTPLNDLSRVSDVIKRIDLFDVDQAGTAMHKGIELGLEAVSMASSEGRVGQLVVLTDGETEGEAVCRELAEQARTRHVTLSVMGVGTEWNSSLIKNLAQLNDGRWYYIDAENPDEALRVFVSEFERLADTGFTEVTLTLKPTKDVKVKRLRQVVPDIHELNLTTIGERHLTADLGTLGGTQSSRYVIDLSLPRRPDGTYAIAQISLAYTTATGRSELPDVPLEIAYTASGQGFVNAEVARHIDEVQIFELNTNLQSAIQSDDQSEARRVAEMIAKKGEVLGPRGAKKTQLARQVLDELDGGGRVSRKTMLAVDDAARLAEES